MTSSTGIPDFVNGMSGTELDDLEWKKSTFSGPQGGNCLEFAPLPDGQGVAVRNSRFPDGPVLVFTDAEIEALILGAKNGDFDYLLKPAPVAG